MRARTGIVSPDLRARIEHLARGVVAAGAPNLPFGLPAMDEVLPGGGLARAALHEIGGEDAAGGNGPATLFAAGIVARLGGPVLWCGRAGDVFGPALAQAGLAPDRVLHADAVSDAEVLFVMEEGLRHAGLAAVVGEVGRLGMTASRRLQLAALSTGVTGFVLRRGKAGIEVEPSAAVTRWRIAPVPSGSLPAPGIERARWRVDLLRCRGGEPASWIMEACDVTGRLALPADLADRPAAQGGTHFRAAG